MLLGGILLTKSKSMEFLVSARTCQPSFGLAVYIFLVADMNNKFKNEIGMSCIKLKLCRGFQIRKLSTLQTYIVPSRYTFQEQAKKTLLKDI